MTAHTPGPWLIATSCSYRRILSEAMLPVCVPTIQRADGHPDLYFPNGGEDGPDARLIAAAPELLEALEGFLSCWDHCIDPREVASKARSAIAKATGN